MKKVRVYQVHSKYFYIEYLDTEAEEQLIRKEYFPPGVQDKTAWAHAFVDALHKSACPLHCSQD